MIDLSAANAVFDSYAKNIRGLLKRPYDMKQWTKEELLAEIEADARTIGNFADEQIKLRRQLKAARTQIRNLKRRLK